MITKSAAIEKFKKQLKFIDELKLKRRLSPDFHKWSRDTEVAIENIFGKETQHIKDFSDIFSYIMPILTNRTTDHEIDNAYQKQLEHARSTLKSFIDEIKEYGEDQNIETNSSPLKTIEKICNRFHLIVCRLRDRHDKRSTLDVKDEYDVQDLLYALLTLNFNDIRKEEWTPSYAGSSSKMDFLLKDENIVIETKMVRKGLVDKKIGEELIIDIEKYRTHPSCKTLICFVYDPEGKIKNPNGIENDLSRSSDGLIVKVIISPKGI